MTPAATATRLSPAAVSILRQNAGMAYEPAPVDRLSPEELHELYLYLFRHRWLHASGGPYEYSHITTDAGLRAAGLPPYETVLVIDSVCAASYGLPYEVLCRCDPDRWQHMTMDSHGGSEPGQPRYVCPTPEMTVDIMLTADFREPWYAYGYWWVAHQGQLGRIVADDEECAPYIEIHNAPHPGIPIILPNGLQVRHPSDAPHQSDQSHAPDESHNIRGGIPC